MLCLQERPAASCLSRQCLLCAVMNQHDRRMSLDEENLVCFGSADHLSFLQVVLANTCRTITVKFIFYLKFVKQIC